MYIYMKLGFSYKFLFYLLLIVILAYIALKNFNLIVGNRGSRGESIRSHAPISQSIAGGGGFVFGGVQKDEGDLSPELIAQSIGGGGDYAPLPASVVAN